MLPFKILRGKKENLPSDATDGQFYVTTDTKQLYMDIGTERITVNKEYSANQGIKEENNTFSINKDELLNMIYPIGSIYTTATNDNPGTLFGGTWTLIGADRVLWGVSASTSAGELLGEQLPNIKGSLNENYMYVGTGAGSGALKHYTTGNCYWGNQSGGTYGYGISFNASNSNSIYKDNGIVRPKAYTVHFWQRTA